MYVCECVCITQYRIAALSISTMYIERRGMLESNNKSMGPEGGLL